MKAFDGLQPHFAKFLQDSTRPDWIIHDYAPYWLPEMAGKYNIPCVYFGTFNAACLCFLGPPSLLLSKDPAKGRFTSLESFITAPKWVPFPSDVVYRMHEVIPFFERAAAEASSCGGADDVSEAYRFGAVMQYSECIALRSCVELEPEWINLLGEITGKPIVPVGSLHPMSHDFPESNELDEEKWAVASEFLERQKDGSVVYVSFGTEAALSPTQVTDLATGLHKSGLPFFWVLRRPRDSSVDNVLSLLPDGFQDRVMDQGLVWTGWAPQVKILAHRSVGGVVTHCGWSSLIEALGLGRALVMIPILSDQGLNARLLEGKKLGTEVPRDQQDGSFTSDSVAESVRRVMVDKEGQILRNNAAKMKVLSDKSQMDHYVDGFVEFLKAYARKPVI